MAAKSEAIELEVGERTVRISNPDRVYFSARGETKLDLARYYMSVGDGIVRALCERPCMLHRFPSGVDGEKVHQKRVPKGAPPWLQTVRITFPRFNRTADELCVTEWPASSGRCRCRRWSFTRGTPGAPTSSTPTSGASTLIRCARAPRGAHRPRGAGGDRRRRLAQDLRGPRDPHLRPHRSRARLRRRAPGRAGVRPRGGAPRAR